MKQTIDRRIALFVLLASLLAAQEPDLDALDTPAAFAGAVAEVEALVAERKWKPAERRLRELLEEHEGGRYVFLHRPLLADVLENCRFWADYESPDPKQLVSGRLRRHTSSGGGIKVAYRRRELAGDFQMRKASRGPFGGESAHFHEALFAGPYTLRINGARFSGRQQEEPTIYACVLPESQLAVRFGRASNPSGPRIDTLAARIERETDQGEEKLDERTPSPATVDEPHDLKVRVGRTSISAFCDGKQIMSARKSSLHYGGVGFAGIDHFEEVIVEGQAQTSWMQGMIDAAVQKRWAEFDESYDVDDDLPDWLAMEPDEWWIRFPAGVYPGERREDQDRLLGFVLEVWNGSREVDRDALRQELRDAPNLTPAFRAYASSILLGPLGDLDRALEECVRARSLAPDFLPAVRYYYLLLERVHGIAAAEESLEGRIDGHPEESWTYARLARLKLWRGDRAGARAVIEAALANSVYTTTLDEVNASLDKGRRGPTWPETHEHRTDHYLVVSDLDRATCIEAAESLESAAQQFATILGPPSRSDHHFPVYLFSGEAGYRRYVRDVVLDDQIRSLGMYIPSLQQLLIWNAPDRDGMMRTIRHEGLHQYLDGIVEDPPIWLNEGLAEYWEAAEFTKLNTFPAHRDNVNTLRGLFTHELRTPLADLLHLDGAEFHARPRIRYAESWLLVHFLRHSTHENRALFDDLLARLRAGEHRREAVDAAFAGVNLHAMEAELDRHLDSLE